MFDVYVGSFPSAHTLHIDKNVLWTGSNIVTHYLPRTFLVGTYTYKVIWLVDACSLGERCRGLNICRTVQYEEFYFLFYRPICLISWVIHTNPSPLSYFTYIGCYVSVTFAFRLTRRVHNRSKLLRSKAEITMIKTGHKTAGLRQIL